MTQSLLSRFLRYARIDTQSDEDSKSTPSTPGQWTLLRMLEAELRSLGAHDVQLTRHGYVLATVPATISKRRAAKVPTVAFLAHVDTAPAFPAHDVRPILHRRWNGKPIRLPEDRTQVLDPALDPALAAAVGKDIVSASGRTLLGADDKAGVAVVLTAADFLIKHPDVPHGKLRICFNPDEEIGRGVDKLELDELGADVAYTFDGEAPGEVSWETFSADGATVTIDGVSTHPGDAKRYGMVNALQLAARLLAALPREGISPETTEAREGFLHPYRIAGGADRVELRFILRDFELAGLAEKRARLRGLCRGIQASEPRARVRCRFYRQYRNMGYWLQKDMTPVDLAFAAMRAVGLTPTSKPARGGTDGSRLTERGLPTPNLFCGQRNPHGPLEWVAVQDMQLAARACVALARLWSRPKAD